MIRFLLDTNVVSEAARDRPDASVLDQLEAHASELAIGAPVLHELAFGVARLAPSRKRARALAAIERLEASSVAVLPYDAEAARWHALERARLEQAGRTPPFVDGQIAAIAVTHGLVLITRNTADFTTFRDLRVESWFR